MQNEPQKKVTPPGWREELLSVKELADRLRRAPRYVYAMKRDGFPMPGGRASVDAALDWLSASPDFRQNSPQNQRRTA